MFSIIVSSQDPAGKNMQKILLENFSFKASSREFHGNPVHEFRDFELVEIPEDQVFVEYLDELNSELLIFASKHASESKKPTLTVHAPGNFGKAELGGKDGLLCPTSALVLCSYLRALKEKQRALSLPYEVSLEVTHHGPFTKIPSVFIELGSCKEQWSDAKAAEAIVETILEKTKSKQNPGIAVGVGGIHYAPAFTALELEKKLAFSHIIPSYALQHFSHELLQQMVEKTSEKVELIAVDWKGLKGEKQRVKEVLESQEIPFERTKALKKKGVM